MSTVELLSPTWEQRFWKKVDKTDNCWMWTGAVNRVTGYGMLEVGTLKKRRMVAAHRLSWFIATGDLPERTTTGLVIDHLCEQKRCVNPSHLQATTQAENVRRWYATHPQTGGRK